MFSILLLSKRSELACVLRVIMRSLPLPVRSRLLIMSTV
jgi:hypothetical protein